MADGRKRTPVSSGKRGKYSVLDILLSFVTQSLDLAVCIYMIFIVAVIPLYTKWDYLHIGSDKIALLWLGCRPAFAVFLSLWAVYLLLLLIKRRRGGTSFCDLLKALTGDASITDLFVLGYGLAVWISYLATDYREEAFMGNEKWGMGMLVQEVFVLSYFGISRMWEKRRWPLGLSMAVSAILFILGCFNRFGIYPIPMKTATSPQFISLAGNINWYCGYMVMPVLACACFFWCYGNSWRAEGIRVWPRIFHLYLFLAFCAQVTNGSSSGLVALSCAFFAMFLLSLKEVGRLLEFCRLCFLLSAACLFLLGIRFFWPEAITYQDELMDLFSHSVLPFLLLIVSLVLWGLSVTWSKKGNYPAAGLKIFGRILAAGAAGAGILFVGMLTLNTLRPGILGPWSQIPALTFSDQWGSNRGATWRAGVWLWRELDPLKKLVGVGPDCMGIHLNGGGGASQELMDYLNRIFPTAKLTNAHCEILTMLDQLGLLGAVSFCGLLFTAIYRYIRQLKWGDFASCVTAACGMGLLAYAVNDMFSFQQVLNGPFMFLLLGIGEAYCRGLKKT